MTFAIVVAAAVLAGCAHADKMMTATSADTAKSHPSSRYEAAVARSRELHRPLVMLIIETGRSEADQRARSAFDATAFPMADMIAAVMDLNLSRDRALLLPFHATDAPTLVCLSPNGVIVSRDESVADGDLILRRTTELSRRAPELDAMLASLRAATASGDSAKQISLADFLLAHANAYEAIAPLTAVSENESADLELRVRAWVELGRAHLWIGEPEKGRYAAIKLAETLGLRTPDAVSGCNLVRGIQDANAKRYDRARDEFEMAMTASPTSMYGKEAADRLAQLPSAPIP